MIVFVDGITMEMDSDVIEQRSTIKAYFEQNFDLLLRRSEICTPSEHWEVIYVLMLMND